MRDASYLVAMMVLHFVGLFVAYPIAFVGWLVGSLTGRRHGLRSSLRCAEERTTWLLVHSVVRPLAPPEELARPWPRLEDSSTSP